MRAALLCSGLAATACSVGEVTLNNTVGGDAGGSAAACVNRLTPAGSAHIHTAGGTSNAGVGCVVAGCHLQSNPGAGAPGYQFAGTVYKPGTTTPSAGAVIRVKSAAGMVVTAYTDLDGNFSIAAGSLPNPFPATSDATACPTVTPMVTPLSQGGGDCNSCHRTGGSAGSVISLAD
jgi:hypothetical protein